MYTKQSLEALLSAEKNFVFSKFDMEDAYKLGSMLFEQGKKEPKPIAVRIILDDLIVYQAFLPGTNAENNRWMDKKCNTVRRTHGCSLKEAVLHELEGVHEEWQKDDFHYAFCGGGFPIMVNGDFRGIACISGLPHLQDHRCLTEVIAKFLGKDPILIPVEN